MPIVFTELLQYLLPISSLQVKILLEFSRSSKRTVESIQQRIAVEKELGARELKAALDENARIRAELEGLQREESSQHQQLAAQKFVTGE